jgi:uroporphyrinogen III methyltransferase/synthase
VAFITGHEDPTKKESNIRWDKLATGAGTLVIFMGIKNLPVITRKLIENGRDPKTPVAVVRWASTPEQQSVEGTLETITEVVQQAGIKPPALIVVGEVVKLRKTIDWYEKRPLFGKRIVVTRTREQASELVALLEEHGANCLEYSTINIEPVDNYQILDRELKNLSSYRWLLLTSLNGVTYFFRRLNELGLDARALAGVKIAVVGKATGAELLKYGIKVDLIPEKFTGEGLAEALIAQGVEGSRILLPRAVKARDVLQEMLTEAGADIVVAPVYQNVPPKGRKDQLREELEEKKVDMVTFTSSSTVTNFLTMVDAASDEELHRLLDDVSIAAIGPITSKTVEDSKLKVDVQPESYTIPDMVNAIVDHYRQNKNMA